ncbi:MaoC family dehydratase [Oceanobacillus piezotolerans]|uniref:MaoC family dehydratase n=1 Tax=Oceanobacillus piezotolerans TaxID=2448030 RepID=A0A498DD21_9BACI|nr:MaoC family dehydratase N-terminal domain-containing protein [Oceanobacillus piezotolerans]RLL46867.1 MaoC family dehydratase [Oceanobacillus piezotolerans]
MQKVKNLIGMEMEPYTFKVEQGKIREFVQAIGDSNPIYYDIESAKREGFENIPIPLTFLTAVEFWGGDNFLEHLSNFQVNPVRVVHGEQEYDLIQDIYAGDILTVTLKVVNVVVKHGSTGGMDLITTENKYKNQKNELVAISKGVTIHRH